MADTTGYCTCGTSWFRLVDNDLSTAAVRISPEGAVQAWSGKFACLSCGKIWEPWEDGEYEFEEDELPDMAEVISLSSFRLKRHLEEEGY